MNLVPYTLTALSRQDIPDEPNNRNIVVGAVVTCVDSQGVVVTMFDDASGANGSTAKQTGVNGQVTVFVPAGEYTFSVSGREQKVVIADAALRSALAAPDSTVLVGGVTAGVVANNLISRVATVVGLFGLVGKQGQFATLRSYWSFSNVGGGLLWYDAFRARSGHNGVTVFSPTVPFPVSFAEIQSYLNGVGEANGSALGCWVRLCDTAKLDVAFAGGVPDKLEAYNSTPCVIAAQNALAEPSGSTLSQSGGEVIFGAGTWIVEGVTPRSGVTWRGVKGATKIRPTATPTNDIIKYSGDGQITNFNLIDLEFVGRGTSQVFGAVNIVKTTAGGYSWFDSVVERCYFNGFGNTVYSNRPGTVRFNNSISTGNDIGLAWDEEHFYLTSSRIEYNRVGVLLGQTVLPGALHFRFTGSVIAHNAEAGVRGRLTEGEFSNCSFIDNGDAHLDATGKQFTLMRFSNCRFQKGGRTDVAILSGANAGAYTDCLFSNCHFEAHNYDVLAAFTGLAFDNCVFKGAVESSIQAMDLGAAQNRNLKVTNSIMRNIGKSAFRNNGILTGLHFSNNTVHDISNTSAGTHSAIESALKFLRGWDISNNFFYETGVARAKFAVDLVGIDPNSDLMTVTNNSVRNYSQANAFPASASTDIFTSNNRTRNP